MRNLEEAVRGSGSCDGNGGDLYDFICSACGKITGSQEELLLHSSFIGDGGCPHNNDGNSEPSSEDASPLRRIPIDPLAIIMRSPPDSPAVVATTAGEGDCGNIDANGEGALEAETPSKGLNGASTSVGGDCADRGVSVGRRRRRKKKKKRKRRWGLSRKSKVSIGRPVAEDEPSKPCDEYRMVDRQSGKEPAEGMDVLAKHRYVTTGQSPPPKYPPLTLCKRIGDAVTPIGGLSDALKVFAGEPKRRFDGVDVLEVVAMKGIHLPPPWWWPPGGYE
ncbi:hypothetical protein QJS04_geneDACA012529 [Acorus gramineus]|uniref:Uncharacterized protein n=1 Tax=Acorus gramineus TaxID=55184 RepID=A0AAV9BAN8_ACOGR|nr:hypothetical protein QJS04_geneDACA012529 [Acorus gramineus]